MEADNRNIIRIDELDDNELKEYLNRFRGRIPSVLLDDLYNKLKGKNVTKEQVDKIIKKIEENLTNARKIDEIFRKLENIESLLKQRVEAKSEIKTQSAQVMEQLNTSDAVQQIAQPSLESAHQVQVQPQASAQVQLASSGDQPRLDVISTSQEPRLKQIPNDAKSIMILLKWIEFMIERVGYDGLEELLNYYVDINWISDNVLFTILRYAKGIRLYHQNSDWRPVGYMNVQDHITSLLFIEALRTGRFNKELVMEVEREIYKIKKEVAEIHGI